MSIVKIGVAAGLVGLLASSQAYAESAGADAEIALLKQQLKLMEQKLDKLQKQTSANTAATATANARVEKVDAKASASIANANAAIPSKAPMTVAGAVVTMPNNRPTICTADNENCISITGRLHFDTGAYDYHPNTLATAPQGLNNGVNARRARLGVTGKFFGDWNYSLIYDFGGSSDGFGGTAAGSLPGGGISGLENAFLSYTGFKPFGGKMAIEGGYMDVNYTLDEATSSNDVTFMERSSAQVIAVNMAAGDFRSSFGARWWNDSFWIGSYVTGPTSGTIHSASSTTPAGTSEQVGVTARAAGQIFSGNGYSVHIGGDGQWLVKPPQNQITGIQSLTYSDRPELRIDPTSIITTGALANVSGAQIYSVEAAAAVGSLFLQGEYYWYNIDRNQFTGQPSNKFEGGYAQASYVLTGEARTYNPATASYNGVVPANPASLTSGGWGAWEIAGRFSQIDLNDELGRANGVAGGRQTVYTAGLNWYVNRNVRFMFNYLHGDITKQQSATNATDTGANFNAVAMRTQIAF